MAFESQYFLFVLTPSMVIIRCTVDQQPYV